MSTYCEDRAASVGQKSRIGRGDGGGGGGEDGEKEQQKQDAERIEGTWRHKQEYGARIEDIGWQNLHDVEPAVARPAARRGACNERRSSH